MAEEPTAPRPAAPVPLLGLSDPLNAPTGFGRVARELFERLPQDRFRLGYVSQWVGSRHFPGVVTYGDPGSRFAANAFPTVALDFAGRSERFVLWTLLDPWMSSWISHPQTSPLGSPATRRFFRDGGRGKFSWVGHWPIDGQGPRLGPGRWVEDYLAAMDVPVAMSRWGREMVQPWMPKGKEVRLVTHAVHDGFRPMDRAEARRDVEAAYARSLLRALAAKHGAKKPDDVVPPEAFAEAGRRMFRLGDRFVAVCVMANRVRKYWPDVLRAFALLAEEVPQARLIGVCGDRTGAGGEDMWPLEDVARELGLRLDEESEEPNVWLIENVEDRPDAERDYSMRLLYCAADVAVLLSGGEGFGLPQLEAHACGIPCVAGNYSASAELAVHAQELLEPSGWMELPQNQIRRPLYRPRDVAQRLRWWAKNAGARREAGLAGQAQAAARRWEKVLPLWLEVFAEAAALIGPKTEATPDGEPRPVPDAAPATVPAPA